MSTTDGDQSDTEVGDESTDGVPEIVPASGDWKVDDTGDVERPDLDDTATGEIPAVDAHADAATDADAVTDAVPTTEPLPATARSEPEPVPAVGEPDRITIDTAPSTTRTDTTTVDFEEFSGGREFGLGGWASERLRPSGRRPRVRRVTRVLRHIDPWSTFKAGLLFSLIAYFICLTSGVLLWRVADSTGTLDNVERWFTQFGWETFEFKGDEIFSNAWVIGLFLVVAATGGLVLLATIFNLVSDVIGGIRVTVLEEEVVEHTRPKERSAAPTTPIREATTDEWSVE